MSIDLKDAIVKTATDLFMTNGYMATSTRQIATILNVSQPAIYHHFKNKEAIYTAVLKTFALEVGLSLQEILDSSQQSQDTLLEMALFLKETHPMNLSLMMHDIENSLSDESEKEIFMIWSMYYFAPFINYFESLKDRLVDDITPQQAAQHFLRILSAYITETKHKNQKEYADVRDMVSIFLRGVLKA